MKKYSLLFLTLALLAACGSNEAQTDAYGNFEAREVLISAESAGKLLWFSADEGTVLDSGQHIGQIDDAMLQLQLAQIRAQHQAILARTTPVEGQIAVIRVQIRNLETEVSRLVNLVNQGAAPAQQLDQLNQNKAVLLQNIKSLELQKTNIQAEAEVVQMQMAVMNEQIYRCRIINPRAGTVLRKFAEAGELLGPGKALYKLANLQRMELKVYVSGNQLPHISLGQQVQIRIDDSQKGLRMLAGSISWISPQAEFTPKIIQTREERVALVYAVKIAVANDGFLKIGMPAEVVFNPDTSL